MHFTPYVRIPPIVSCLQKPSSDSSDERFSFPTADVCPDAKGRFRQNSNVRQHHSPSLGFLIEPKNTTRCLGEAARLRVFYLGDNSTRVTLYKNQPTTNAAAAQQIVMDGKKYHVSCFIF